MRVIGICKNGQIVIRGFNKNILIEGLPTTPDQCI